MRHDLEHGDVAEATCDALRGGRARLVTLLGPGGIGKSHVADQIVARLLADGFAVETVELDRFDSAEPALARVAQALHDLAPTSGAGRVLVIHNAERLGTRARELAELLTESPDVRFLATSRVATEIRAEQRQIVPPLSTEAATELLLTTATRLSCEPDLELKQPLLQAICQRLEGHPLAVLLAANQLSGLTAASLLSRLEEGWSPAMRRPADIPERHATLARTLADSTAALSPDARALLLVLGAFDADFEFASVTETVQATGILSEDELSPTPVDPAGVWDAMHELITHSLLSPVPSAGTWPLESFALSATVRDFARLQAQHSPHRAAILTAHAEHALTHVRAGAGLSGAEAEAWLRRTDAKHADLTSALAHLIEAGDPLSLDLAAGLRGYWMARGLLREGIAALDAALALETDHDSARWVRALEARAILIGAASSYTVARADLETCLLAWERLGEPLARARSLVDVAAATYEAEGLDAAAPLFEEAIDILDAGGDLMSAARARSLYGASAAASVAASPEGRGLAMSLLDQAIEAFGRLEETSFTNVPLQQMGRLLLEAGHDAQAVAILNRGLRLVTDAGDDWNASVFNNLLAEVGIARGNTLDAAEHHLEALRLSAGIGAAPRFIWCLEGLATTIDDLGEKEYAARLIGLVHAQRSSLNLHDWLEFPARPVDLSGVQRGLSADRYATLLIEGEQMSIDEVIQGVPELLESKRGKLREGTASHPDRLTSREVEVLRLVASGLTSRAIATELFISIETVGRHITNLYRKIGVSGRAEATAYAITSGLMGS